MRAALRLTQEFGHYHATTGMLLNNLAELLREQKRNSEAEHLYREALAVFASTVGDDHEEYGNTLNNLALCYQGQDKHEEAEAAFLQALAVQEKATGTGDVKHANTLYNLGQFYYDRHRDAESDSVLRQAWSGFRIFSGEHALTGLSLYHRRSLAPQKRYEGRRRRISRKPSRFCDVRVQIPTWRMSGTTWLTLRRRGVSSRVGESRSAVGARLIGGPKYPGVHGIAAIRENLLTLGHHEKEARAFLMHSIAWSVEDWQGRTSALRKSRSCWSTSNS